MTIDIQNTHNTKSEILPATGCYIRQPWLECPQFVIDRFSEEAEKNTQQDLSVSTVKHGHRPAASSVHYTTSCNTQSSVPEDGQTNCPKHAELTGIINKPLLLHLVGCLYYLYQ